MGTCRVTVEVRIVPIPYQYTYCTHIMYFTYTGDGTSSIDTCNVPVSLLFCQGSLLLPILVHTDTCTSTNTNTLSTSNGFISGTVPVLVVVLVPIPGAIPGAIPYTYNTGPGDSLVHCLYLGQYWYFGTLTGTELHWYI